jgi:hypothetical protein
VLSAKWRSISSRSRVALRALAPFHRQLVLAGAQVLSVPDHDVTTLVVGVRSDDFLVLAEAMALDEVPEAVQLDAVRGQLRLDLVVLAYHGKASLMAMSAASVYLRL